MSKSKHHTQADDNGSDEEKEKTSSTAPKEKRRRLSADGTFEGALPQAHLVETHLVSASTSSSSCQSQHESSVDPETLPVQSEKGDSSIGELNVTQNRNFFCGLNRQESDESLANDPLSNIDDKDQMLWGPYLSERQWGTVREDYSEDDNNWDHVTYEKAINHAYVSGEDGLLGVSDKFQLFCASPALWNGKDPILKERLFGLTGVEGNHGEDVKECYYYLDSLPDHSYMRALYKYPQEAFPYQQLRDENRRRSFHDPEFELTDTDAFSGGYWDVMIEYIKLENLGLACHIEVVNNGSHPAMLHLMPQFYFRHVQKNEPVPNLDKEPIMKAASDGAVKINYHLGDWRIRFPSDKRHEPPVMLYTNNTSANVFPLQLGQSKKEVTTYTKGAFQKYIVEGKKEAVSPVEQGTKCGAYYKLTVGPNEQASVYWKLDNLSAPVHLTFRDLQERFSKKRREVQTYYEAIMPNWPEEHRNIGAQAMAGLHWSKQFYIFDVRNWLEDYRRCSANRGKKRNSAWSHVHNHHILLMPDKWEFPWYAGWDLMVSAVLYARFSLPFAKHQITTFLSDNYMHPHGKLPGCEFELDDINPPLQAWAVLKVFHKDPRDTDFLRKCFHRLLLNYNWWMNQEYESSGLFGRGFLGMDNISVVDRSGRLPDGWYLVQADFTGWMACYSLWMMEIAVELSQVDRVYCDMIHMFLRHFIDQARAMNRPIGDNGLWHEDDRFLYDVFCTPWGPIPIQLRSLSGLVPLLACTKIRLKKLTTASICMDHYIRKYPEHFCKLSNKNHEIFISVLCLPRAESIFQRVFNEEEFLAPYGIRSLSKVYENNPLSMQVGGDHYMVKYTPGESDSGTFGGNSNWRGPVWLFMNWLLLEAMDLYNDRASISHVRLPSVVSLAQRSHSVGYQSPSTTLHLQQRTSSGFVPSPGSRLKNFLPYIAHLEKRLLSIFLPDIHGVRPIHGETEKYSQDPRWRHLVLFYEYIHADTGRGCGASHQTGWTAAIVEIMYRLHSRSSRKSTVYGETAI